ncbi:MAG: DUF3786 domain-containing protein [bacterium]
MGCAAPNPIHWRDLRSRPREMVLAQPGVTAGVGQGYEVRFLNGRVLVDPERASMKELEPDPERIMSEVFQILVLNYLCGPHGGALTGEVVSEKELPAGATFFRGPHELQVHSAVEAFGGDAERFERCGRALGGELVDHGDRAVRLWPFPEIPVTFVLWLVDEEFPASISVLFDRSISRWFELDMVFLLVQVLSQRLVRSPG